MSHINEIETVQEANEIASVLVEFVKGEIAAAAPSPTSPKGRNGID